MKNLLLLIFVIIFIFGCKEEKPKVGVRQEGATLAPFDSSKDYTLVTYSEDFINNFEKSKVDTSFEISGNKYELKITGKYFLFDKTKEEDDIQIEDVKLYFTFSKNSKVIFKKAYSNNDFHKKWGWLASSVMPFYELDFKIDQFGIN